MQTLSARDLSAILRPKRKETGKKFKAIKSKSY